MKAHFTCSTNEFEEHFELYKTIRKVILQIGIKITRDWIYEEISLRKKGIKRYSVDVYEKTIQAILDADVVIIEGSIPSFHIGHQITIALQKNKPVLLLTQKLEEGKWPFITTFHNEHNKRNLLHVKKYTKRSLKTIIKRFLKEYKKGPLVRFNLFLDNTVDSYLDWASFTYRKSKSEIIRDLIKRNIDSVDKKYQKYLKESNLNI